MRLDEKYRPRDWPQVIAQDKTTGLLKRLETGSGLGGRAYWITGKSGTGKTTIARIIASKFTSNKPYETTGREVTPKFLRDWAYCLHYVPIPSWGHALIINEAHGLNKPSIEVLLDILENLNDNALIVFTTTNDGLDLFEEKADSGPFASRCLNLSLARRDLGQAFAKRLKEIAQAENLDGQPIEAYHALLNRKDVQNNFRAALRLIEQGVMLDL